ncbi:hypothetical protein RHSIM_Rhsim13G0221100 [Rhododendron simsii]|uniref:TF-B3 domain-containing protein n=1 Tax=Rhododendron simsii TaxID=118357 RepID=A0A834L5H0_RHOSS|nr:hypothetical protein RHSIM_Rhsim13G0221100 [Rhododendron simsii]
MVVHVPFVHWAHVKNPALASLITAVFYLQTAGGQRVVCALALRDERNRITYRAFDNFLEDYRQILPLGGAIQWNFGCLLLHGYMMLYTIRSFGSVKKHIRVCVSRTWHLKYVGPADSTERLPRGLCHCFPANGASTWILLRHGSRASPVKIVNFKFGEGWDTFCEVHKLKVGFKVTMVCEQSWIFHTAIFDENDQELVYQWPGPNLQCREFHAPPGHCAYLFNQLSVGNKVWLLCFISLFWVLHDCGNPFAPFASCSVVNLRTACLPSATVQPQTVLKFGYRYVPGRQLRVECETRLSVSVPKFQSRGNGDQREVSDF